jgi:tripartite-type tricarboxylate transporter receptor subunit TctC
VPYKGSGDAIKDLLAGVVAMNFDTMPPSDASHSGGQAARPWRSRTPEAPCAAPSVPTFLQEGITGFDVSNWYGVSQAPAGTPREIVRSSTPTSTRAMQVAEVRALEGVGSR